jgi:hypothetical protein
MILINSTKPTNTKIEPKKNEQFGVRSNEIRKDKKDIKLGAKLEKRKSKGTRIG